MPNNRNPYYRVYVGDELRLLKNLSTDAYGVYGKFRNWVHDADPYGHLVDAHGVPLADAALIDLSGLRASAFRAAFEDLCSLRAVWTSRAWLAQAEISEHAGYVEVARELCVGLRRLAVVRGGSAGVMSAPDDREPLLLPALADQYVRSIYGKRTGPRKGGKKGSGTGRGTSGGTSGPPPRSPLGWDVRSDVGVDPDAHCHESDNDTDSKVLTLPFLGAVSRERDSPQRVREEPTRPMTWNAYRTHCMRVAQWQKRLEGQYPDGVSEDRLAALYEAEFHETWEAWQYMKRAQEASIPQPCRDGHHVFDGVHCRYCPVISVGGEN